MALLAILPSSLLRIFASMLIILFCSHNPIGLSAQSSGDEAALISFKFGITYDKEGALISWGNTSLHFCNWFGVTCSNHSNTGARVTALDLKGAFLSGFLSPSLGSLTFLEKLDISDNQLSGPIPHEFGSLSNLRSLNLSSNLLSGEIPHTLSHCSLLQNISLGKNMLSGKIPANLSFCSELQIIDFRANYLAGIIPVSLGTLKSLKGLILANNRLQAMEKSDWDFFTALVNCTSLESLWLGYNNLTGQLPDSIANLSVNLIYLSMDYNQIYGGIPLGIVKLVNLQIFSLGFNLLNGTIPPSIGELPKLEILYLRGNQFSGAIPTSFCNMSFLTELFIGTNNLDGDIPPCFGNHTSLISLDLSQNNLTGHIPSSLGHLFKLERIYLFSNNLYENIPPSLGNLQSLLILNLGFNNFSGFIPNSLWNLTSLVQLYIGNNNLIGTLPMKTLPSLQYLVLSTNKIHGPIPTSLFNSSALVVLMLDENLFDGIIHKNIGNLKSLSIVSLSLNNLQASDIKEWSFISTLANCTYLKILDLNGNELEGNLPHSIVNLSTTLNTLRLEWNNISGNIPIEIDNLSGLNWFSAGLNSLTGTIPMGIGKLSLLQRLCLHNNSFTGEIPHNLGNLSMLNDLYLHINNFSGYIPSSLGRCKQLTSLYLQYNQLTGPIPKEILSITSLSFGIDLSNNLLVGPLPDDVGFLINLLVLNVSNNKLMGQIPSSLAQCVQLTYLCMEDNFFQGNIPSSLGALKSLELLNLSHNNLCGEIPKSLEPLHRLDLSYNQLEGEVPKNGIFLNASAFSVYGNDKLCGGIAELNLQPCFMNNIVSRKDQISTIVLEIVIPITCIIFSLIILLFVFLMSRRKKFKKLSLSKRFENNQIHVKVSYDELRRATNRFSSNNLIGRGNFGSVYMGNIDQYWKKSIAVKVLNLQQRGASKSFEVECKALRNIQHRNLVKILTSCSSIDHEGNDFKALVFEYMPNGNLDKWLHQQSIFENESRRNLTLIQRTNIIIDVASALDYLHNHGPVPVVHCDMKPSNILLDEDMIAHVSDFGLARLLDLTASQSSKTSTSSVTLKGTIGYAAPEYGAANQVSIEGDVYSYGIIILEMITGRRPIDEIFNEGLNLHEYVKAALPERVMDIVDPYLLLQKKDDELGEGLWQKCMRNIDKHELECIISVLKVGLLCSDESPIERMPITQALNELYSIRNHFLKSSNITTTLS